MAAPGRAGARSLFVLVVLVLVISGGAQWWSGRADQRIGSAVAAAAKPGDILMLSSVSCPYCAAARVWLNTYKVPFDECFIERDAVCRAAFDRLQARGTPTLVVRDRTQTGFDPQRVLQALET